MNVEFNLGSFREPRMTAFHFTIFGLECGSECSIGWRKFLVSRAGQGVLQMCLVPPQRGQCRKALLHLLQSQGGWHKDALASPHCVSDWHQQVSVSQRRLAWECGEAREGKTRAGWGVPDFWSTWICVSYFAVVNLSSPIGMNAAWHRVRGLNFPELGLRCSQTQPCTGYVAGQLIWELGSGFPSNLFFLSALPSRCTSPPLLSPLHFLLPLFIFPIYPVEEKREEQK